MILQSSRVIMNPNSNITNEVDDGLLHNIMPNSSLHLSQLASDNTHYNHNHNYNYNYNPYDFGSSWIQALLNDTVSSPSQLTDLHLPQLPLAPPQPPDHHQTAVVTEPQQEEEDSAIKLVHMLISCAESLQRGHVAHAASLIDAMQSLLRHVSTASAIGKVAAHFIHALTRRIYAPLTTDLNGAADDGGVLYHHFYEACPYLKFAHFTANQAILEAFSGHNCVHVIDFHLAHGLQWPPLIQALALRPGGPPSLRITGIGPPSPDGRDSLRETGLRLAELARSVNVRFAFRGVAASRLEDVEPWMLQVRPEEAVAVNSVMQLHRLLGSDPIHGDSGIESLLGWIRRLKPKIVTVVEQEANHNQTGFLERFTEALHYYSAVFDSLEACPVEPDKALAEMYLEREICNVVCCEGPARVERHERLAQWKARLEKAGFKCVGLGSNALRQASMLLSLFSAEGYCVEEKEGCLTLGWHGRPLIAASAWQPLPLLPHTQPHRLA